MKGLRIDAWIRHRVEGRFALVVGIENNVVFYWKEEAPTLTGCTLEDFPAKWSVFHGYKTYGQKEAPNWVTKGTHIYERSSGVRCVVLGTRLRGAWVMLEATPWLATAEHRWLTVRTGGAFNRDFAHLPDRFDRPDPI